MQSHYRRNRNPIKATDIQAAANTTGIKEGDKWYFFGEDPALGWSPAEGGRYCEHDFLDPDFSVNVKDIDANGYYFDENQILYITGISWLTIGTTRIHHDKVLPEMSFVQISKMYSSMVGLRSDGSAWAWGENGSGQLGDFTTTNSSSPVSVVGDHSFISLGISGANIPDFTVGLKQDGTAWTWGNNSRGNLGDFTTTDKSSPVSVVGNHSFIKIICSTADTSAESKRAHGLKADGTVWSWGYGLYGELGIGAATSRSSPVSVVGDHSFIDITAGWTSTFALKSDGSVWSWGGNKRGQLGDLTTTDRNSPVQMVGGHSFVKIFCAGWGDSSNNGGIFVGVKENGDAWTCGCTRYMPIGTYNVNNSSPVAFSTNGFFKFKKFAGNHLTSFYLDDYNQMWYSGMPMFVNNQSYNNVAGWRSSPVLVFGTAKKYLQTKYDDIKLCGGAGQRGYIARTQDGVLYFWGSQGVSAYGLSGGTNFGVFHSNPVKISEASFAHIWQSGSVHAFALTEDGKCWGWGNNTYGRLGDGTIVGKATPQEPLGGHSSFIKILAIQESTVGLKSDGTVWTWGRNNIGQLGDFTTTNSSSPVSVVGDHSFVDLMESGASYHAHVMALKEDGTVWGWGPNTSAQIGDYTMTNRSSPVSVVGDHSFISIACSQTGSTGLKIDGSVWSWGAGTFGRNGVGNTTAYSSPVSVIGNHSFIKISGGYEFSIALKEDGTVWGWGSNTCGQLGTFYNGSGQSSPIKIINYKNIRNIQTLKFPQNIISMVHTAKNAIFIDELNRLWVSGQILKPYGDFGTNQFYASIPQRVNFNHTAIPYLAPWPLMSDGTSWGWGSNTYGQLGDGTTTDKSIPVSVIGDHSFIRIHWGPSTKVALKADGTAWTWGYATQGQLGNGYISHMSSPTSVIGDHSFVQVNFAYNSMNALKEDGSAWGWGVNTAGELGDYTMMNRSSPVSVVGDHSFIYVNSGWNHTVALKEDGSVWGWGAGNQGQLGDLSLTNKSSPVSVAGGHSFIKVSARYAFSVGLKADGTCWSWGYASNGMLGDGTATRKSSPVSVVGNHSFIDIISMTQPLDGVIAKKADGTLWMWGLGPRAFLHWAGANVSSPTAIKQYRIRA